MSEFYLADSALCGTDTKIWHFAVILERVIIGDNCSIGAHSEIGRGTSIGDGSRISAKVFLPSNTKVGMNVFIGPGTIATDDLYPRMPKAPYDAKPPVFEDGCSVGAGCVILPGVTIGAGAMVGAGSTVAEDVPPGAVVYGPKATIKSLPNPSV